MTYGISSASCNTPRLNWRSADVALCALASFLPGEKAPPTTRAGTVTHYTGNSRLLSRLMSRLYAVDSLSSFSSMAQLRAKNGRYFRAVLYHLAVTVNICWFPDY